MQKISDVRVQGCVNLQFLPELLAYLPSLCFRHKTPYFDLSAAILQPDQILIALRQGNACPVRVQPDLLDLAGLDAFYQKTVIHQGNMFMIGCMTRIVQECQSYEADFEHCKGKHMPNAA